MRFFFLFALSGLILGGVSPAFAQDGLSEPRSTYKVPERFDEKNRRVERPSYTTNQGRRSSGNVSPYTAQKQQRYGASSGSVSPYASGSGAPLNLNGILQGSTKPTRSYGYNQRATQPYVRQEQQPQYDDPYNLSIDEIKEQREAFLAKNRALNEQRTFEFERRAAAHADYLRDAKEKSFLEQELERRSGQINGTSSVSSERSITTNRKQIYINKDEQGLTVPPRIFNAP